jgi:hypothetical protein
VLRAKNKNAAKAADKCIELPTIAATDAATGNAAAVTRGIDLIHDLFGNDLDMTIQTLAADRAISLCQQTALKEAQKCQNARLKQFNKCKKLGLKGKLGPGGSLLPFGRVSDVGLCFPDDPKGKVGKACETKLAAKLQNKCGGLDQLQLDEAVPGCTGSDIASLPACVARHVACRACNGLNEADALTIGCDAVDNAAFDGSCP